MTDPLKPEEMTPAEKAVDTDRKRQLNTLIGLSEKFDKCRVERSEDKLQFDIFTGCFPDE